MKRHSYSAIGASSIVAWGNAPGIGGKVRKSAESAPHSSERTLNRAFSADSKPKPQPWGVAPGSNCLRAIGALQSDFN